MIFLDLCRTILFVVTLLQTGIFLQSVLAIFSGVSLSEYRPQLLLAPNGVVAS